MEHAWLVFSRYRVDAIETHTVTLNGEAIEATKAEAPGIRARLQKKADEENMRTREEVLKKRREWSRSHTKLRSSVPKGVQGHSAGWEIKHFDEVSIDGVVQRVAAGSGEVFVAKEAERRFPMLLVEVKDAISVEPEKRSWKSRLITSTETIQIPEPDGLSWSDGAPSTWIAEKLDSFSKSGWNLIHVSEDHGLYQGADVPNESYPTRIRFLLQRSTSINNSVDR